jgi:hypothetical protein
MAEWFYTTNKQQMGPVSLAELRQLAEQGLLKPTDLVWSEGMKDWARAGARGLFHDSPDLPESQPRRSEREYDDDEDEGARRPRRRRARRSAAGMSSGLKVGLIAGGAVLLLVIVGVVLFVALKSDGGQTLAGPGDYKGFLSLNDSPDSRRGTPCRIYTCPLVQGRVYFIDLRSNEFDSYLRLENSQFVQLAEDDDSGGGHNARIVMKCPQSGTYRIIATCFAPGQGAFTLSIRQQ